MEMLIVPACRLPLALIFLMLAENMLIISAEIDQNRGPGL